MTSRGNIVLALVVGLLVTIAGERFANGAGCNIVPREVRLYRSGSGLVDRPVASPGDVVTLSADLACKSAGAGFALEATDNTVTLEFLPPAGVPHSVTVPPASLRVDACSDTRCNALEFQLPDTAGQFGLPAGRPLTGPAHIRVSRVIGSSPFIVVDVFQLQQPSLACEDVAADDVFGKFTVLPRPNVLATPGIAEFIGAVDGYGNLLIPVDFSDVLLAPPGDPIATILEISTPATTAIPDSRFLRAFNAFGRPVPPLLRLDSMKRIIGTTDVLRSVLRVARVDPDSPGAPIGTPEQDMVQGSGGEKIGPVVLGGPQSPSPVSVLVRSAVPLLALKLGVESAAVGAGEAIVGEDLNLDGDQTDLIVQVTDLLTGQQTNTGKALAEVTASPKRPALVLDGDRAAFLESEARSGPTDYNDDGDRMDSILRAYSSLGTELTPAPVLTVDPHPIVNGRPLAISRAPSSDAPYLFFRRAEADESDRTTKRVSENSAFGAGDSRREANSNSTAASLDLHGVVVAFASQASNLVAGDSGGWGDVFVKEGSIIRRMSEIGGVGGSGDSKDPAISADGRYVTFLSQATNLISGNSETGTVVWERLTVSLSTTTIDGGSSSATAAASFNPGAEDVPGVDYSPANPVVITSSTTATSPTMSNINGTAVFGGGSFSFSGTAAYPPIIIIGAKIKVMATVNPFSAVPPLPASLSNLTFEATVTVTHTERDCLFCELEGFDSAGNGILRATLNLGSEEPQVLVRNRSTSGLELMSKSTGGVVGDAKSGPLSISGDGRFVAFASYASNLVLDDTNGKVDVFLHDRDPDENGVFDEAGHTSTSRVSRSVAAEGNGDSIGVSISSDGRFVAFDSDASNLVTGDGNGVRDIFVFDRQTQVVERVSVGDGAVEGNSSSAQPWISADGRFVAFSSNAFDLVSGDSNAQEDIFVFDRTSRTIERVSLNNQGVQALGGPSSGPSIGADGRFVAFVSKATNLTSPLPDANGAAEDVFVVDRLTHHIEQSSVSAAGVGASAMALGAAISGDGRAVGFYSAAGNLIASDTTGQTDVFVRGIDRSGPSLNPLADADVDDTVAQAFDLTGGALLSNLKTAARSMTVAAARALVLVSEGEEGSTNLNGALASLLPPAFVVNDTDQTDTVAQLFDAPTNMRLNLGVAASQAALSNEVLCLAVSEAAQGDGGGTDLDADGDKKDDVLVVGTLLPAGAGIVGNQLVNTGLAVDTVFAVGSACVVISPEAAQGPTGTDLNGDNDTLDRVLQIWATGGTSPGRIEVRQAARDLFGEPGTPLVAFRTCEADQGAGGGTDLNKDTDKLDCVMQVYDLELAGIVGAEPSPDPSMALTNTQREAIVCDFPGCEAFRLASIVGRTVSFVGTEEGQTIGVGCLPSSRMGECDLDGDGDGMGRVVHVVTLERGVITSTLVLPVSDVQPPELSPLAEAKGGGIQTDVLITECEAARLTCPETRTRVPVEGFLTVQTACEAASDISPAGPNGNGDGLLDCVTPRFFFAGDKDGDGVIDVSDSCVEIPNPSQVDADLDGLGDPVASPGCDPNPASLLPGDRNCDLNGDSVIDTTDLDLIFHDRNTPAAASDQRDRNRDLMVTVLDHRICSAQCTNPDCAPNPPECGLLGIEALLPLVLLARRRRTARAQRAPS